MAECRRPDLIVLNGGQHRAPAAAADRPQRQHDHGDDSRDEDIARQVLAEVDIPATNIEFDRRNADQAAVATGDRTPRDRGLLADDAHGERDNGEVAAAYAAEEQEVTDDGGDEGSTRNGAHDAEQAAERNGVVERDQRHDVAAYTEESGVAEAQY